MTQNPESEAGTARARPWRMLVALAVAQLIVAVSARITLWPPDSLAELRTPVYFTYWDMVAIAIWLGGAMAALAATERWRITRRVVMVLASFLAVIHCILLVGNISAIYWLRVPVTWQWLYFSDLGRTQTPLVVMSSVITPATIAGLIAAVAAPSLTWQLIKRLRGIGSVWFERTIALAALIAITALPVLKASDPPVRDRWRDAVSNPAMVLARSMVNDGTAALAATPSDGRVQDYAVLPAAPAETPIAAGRPDIVLVVLESVGRDHVMENRAALPTFDALITRGTHYPNAGVTNSNSVRSIFELYFSRFPVVGYQPESYLYDRIDTTPVPVAIERAGYRSALFMASDLGYQDAGAFLARHGVTGLNDIEQIACDDRIGLSSERWQNNDYLPDRCVFDATARWLLGGDRPAFATIWTGPTHFPYSPAIPNPASDPQKRHLQALQETDQALGAFLDTLEEAGRNPLVVVVGDHAEAFGKHGTNVHGYTIFEDETAIPFIMAGPGVEADASDDRLVSLADIGPTLLDYVGGARPAGWQGLSALAETRRDRTFRFAILEAPIVGYREGSRKYVLNLRDDTARIYDLENDPDEQSPAPATDAQKRSMERAIAGWMRYNRELNQGGANLDAP